jgi:BirA family biotin operon repressor/biotin-[acetyl-CoA-carboxylase] ligase
MADSERVLPSGRRVLRLAEVDSTNTEALRRAVLGERGPLWILADRQRRGRGRNGRNWTSEPGNLYASLLIALDAPPRVAHHLSLLAGVAVFDAVRDLTQAEGQAIAGLRLKWPNDVLIGSAKFIGILPESSASAGGGLLAVIGVGINLDHHPSGLNRELTHLSEHGVQVTPEIMLARLDEAIDMWLTRWNGGFGFSAVRAAWLERAGRPGEAIAVDTGAGRMEGTYAGIDDDGGLLVRDEQGREHRFTYGDVTLGA